MKWFIFSVIALLCWSFSDLFSKLGCADSRDKHSALKMVTAVGVVMGIHAAYTLIFTDVEFTFKTMLTYLPVSLLYISSMTIGYVGLRFIELSISSPICNSSGALVSVICIITGAVLVNVQYVAIALVAVGVVGLGIAEMTEDDDLRKARQSKSNYKYTKSFLAILLPVIYCLLDALGTFADSLVLEKLDEDAANTAYELTFLICGIICFIYVKFIKKDKFLPKKEAPKYIGAAFETAGQFAYIYALADSEHVALSAPIISAYCAASVLWGRIFLKEKLSWKHYLCIFLTVAGIVILGIYDA
ncbi:MAG: DMT family transporter [Oscillospiraceae bacterium]|nr:DMT family transporter [Clostridiaceae bacterium]MDY5934628.1 DMT family transporter [Oscillospiraceae bacterium]